MSHNADQRPSDVSPPGGTYHAVHDGEQGSLSTSVAEAVADALDLDPTETQIPLEQHVDPDALDAIFRDQLTGTPRTDARVAFTLWDVEVVVHADGHIFVHPLDDAERDG